MAFTVTARHVAAPTTSAGTSRTTNSVTPTADSLLLLGMGALHDSDVADAELSVSGGSLTWTDIQEIDGPSSPGWNTDPYWRMDAGLYRATIGASPSAFTTTAATNINSYICVVACDITGHDTTTPVVQSAINSATVSGTSSGHNATVTLSSAPTVGNLVVLFAAASADSAGAFSTPYAGSGNTFTASYNQDGGYNHNYIGYRVVQSGDSSTIQIDDVGDSVGNWVLIAVEIAAESGGGTTLTVAPLDHAVALDGPLTITEHTAASLVVQPLDLAVTVDQVALTQARTLAVADMLLPVSMSQEGLPLTQTHNVAVNGSDHTTASDQAALVSLSIASTDHTHAADGVVLEHIHVLSIDEARHETRDASGVFTDSFDYSAGDLHVVSSDWNAQGGATETFRTLVPWNATGSGGIEAERSLNEPPYLSYSSAALIDRVFGSDQWMEVDFQVPATVNESWAIEICLRFRDDATTGYLVSIYNWLDASSGYGGVSVGYFPSGGDYPEVVAWEEVANEVEPFDFTPGQTYTFRAVISGSTATAYLDGVQMAQWTDDGTVPYAQFDSGRMGLIGYSENYDEAWTNFDSPQIVDVRAAGNVSLVAVDDLSVQGSDHVIASDNVTLSVVDGLAIADAAHATSSDNVTVVSQDSLSIQNADHLTTSDDVSLSQIHSLSVSESTHTHASGNITLLGQGDLDIASADHVVASDQADLTSVSMLSIADADHSIVSDEAVLGGYADLTIAGSSVATTSDEIRVIYVGNLVVQDAYHTVASDSLELFFGAVLDVEGDVIGVTSSVPRLLWGVEFDQGSGGEWTYPFVG